MVKRDSVYIKVSLTCPVRTETFISLTFVFKMRKGMGSHPVAFIGFLAN